MPLNWDRNHQVNIITNMGPLPGQTLCRNLGISYEEALTRTGRSVGMQENVLLLALRQRGYRRVKYRFSSVILELCRERGEAERA